MLIYYFKMNIETQWIDGKMLIALLICILVSVPQTSSNDISMNVFGKDRNALPAAFGDFNSDELTDIFMLRDEGKTLEIFLASEKEPLLRPGVGLKCVFTEYRVTSVVPGDFDGDAFMDILITTQNITIIDKPSRNQDIRIIWGGEDSLNCSLLDLPTVITTVGHPLAMDYNRDMIIDLFGVSVDNIRSFWVFNHNRTIPEKIPLCEDSYHEVRLPHSNSFLDIDGDYASDLLITSPTSFEVWIGDVANPGFTLKNKIEMPIGVSGHIGQSLYLDVELTGKLYLLLPICFDKDCRSSSIMINDDSVWKTLNIEFKDKNQKEWGFFPPNGEIYRDTITMRGGDYNMDGYPDLLVTLQKDALSEPQAFLMENVPCEACPFARTYTIQWDALQPFGKGTILSVFYDFYQDGVLDFILVQQNTTTKEYRVGAMKNSLDYDANFIKVMVLTGLTNKKVPVTVGALGKKKGTYGTNLPGPKISYNTLSQDGLPRSGVCVQLPQSAYFVLNLPFSIFGLDRTPNFVDTLTVGLSNRSRTWTQLIPNSQVVVIPWPPSDPARWRAQLFVTPSKLILKSVFVITGLCGVITLLVLILHYKEKRDDRIEALSANNDDSDNEVLS